jgi:hypothetical protein
MVHYYVRPDAKIRKICRDMQVISLALGDRCVAVPVLDENPGVPSMLGHLEWYLKYSGRVRKDEMAR